MGGKKRKVGGAIGYRCGDCMYGSFKKKDVEKHRRDYVHTRPMIEDKLHYVPQTTPSDKWYL